LATRLKRTLEDRYSVEYHYPYEDPDEGHHNLILPIS